MKWQISDDQTSSESYEEATVSDVKRLPVTSGALTRKVKLYTECLVDLGPSLRCPAQDTVVDESTQLPSVEQRSGDEYHTELLSIKFPSASTNLLKCMGKASWNRYRRLQQERLVNEHHRLLSAAGNKSHATNSTFQDSGIGQSTRPAASSYAGSMLSFVTAIAGGKRVRVPPLPSEAKRGLPFECDACGKNVRVWDNRSWR